MGKQAPAKSQPPRDVMIIPTAGATDPHGIYKDNRRFGKDQWAAASPTERAIVELAPNATLESVMKDAAQKARLGPNADGVVIPRRVILLIGHGGAAGERAQEVTSFDTVPEPGGFSEHRQKITKDTLQLGIDIESGKIQVKDPDSPNPTFKQGNAGTTDPAMTANYRKYRMLKRIGAILRNNKVAQFILLSCAAGSDPELAPMLSKILGVRVGAYRQLVSIGALVWTTSARVKGSLEQIWLAPLSCKTPQDVERFRPAVGFNPDGSPRPHPSFRDYPEPEVFAP
jgi:hypothetical protein